MGFKKNILFTPVLIIILSAAASGQNVITNLELFDRIISEGLEKFFYLPGIDRSKQFVFIINSSDKEKSDYLQRIIKRTAGEEKINISFAGPSDNIINDSVYKAEVTINKLSVSYPGFRKNNFLGEKTVTREVTADIVLRTTGIQITEYNINDTRKDELDIDDIEKAESSQFRFMSAKHPEAGAFESVVFPVILAAASAAAIILFFVVRTK